MKLLSSGLLTLLVTVPLLTAQHAHVSFDSFEYSGEDKTLDRPLNPGEFHNPILTGFYPDPSICRVGNDYYLVNSTFTYFPGLPIFHSKDLVNWKQIGNVIDRPEQLKYEGLDVSRGIFAPAITHHDGTFYLICTQVGSNGNFIVTAKNPAGPWSDPISLKFAGIDPSLFFDDDGRVWIVNNDDPTGPPLYKGHRAIRIQELDLKAMQVTGPREVLVNGGVDISKKPIWIEGPHLFKRDGWYYLSAAEGGTGPDHSQVILRSKQVGGPYQPWEKNPILTQRGLDPSAPGAVTCAGHADLEIGPDGKWWATFLGVRPYGKNFSPMGRETFLLPVEWTDDGWPIILPAGERVPLFVKSPNGAVVEPTPGHPLSGSFTWRDDFTLPKLSPAWIMLRAPKDAWWKLDGEKGVLSLTPRPETLDGRSNPSFLGRRVQHPQFTASTTMDIPKSAGVSAGLVAFQNRGHHYFLAVQRTGSEATLRLECVKGDQKHLVASTPLPDARKIDLRIRADGPQCSFDYALKPSDWKPLGAAQDAKLLTTAVAGGFVGTTVGIHARTD
jgi:xylan 1,4-beta-xylosidase